MCRSRVASWVAHGAAWVASWVASPHERHQPARRTRRLDTRATAPISSGGIRLVIRLTNHDHPTRGTTGGSMAQRIPTRLGDGSLVEMTRAEVEADLACRLGGGRQARQGRAAHARRPRPPARHLHLPGQVQRGRRRRRSRPLLRRLGQRSTSALQPEQLLVYQNHLGADILELGTYDYSYKAVQTVVSSQTAVAEGRAAADCVVPLNYGAMPDLGRYSRPDGPAANWSELMPLGKIDEARAAQDEAIELAVDDMVVVGDRLGAAGVDGLDFDTAGASGDADLLATLRTARSGARRRSPTSASRSAWRPRWCSACTASSTTRAGGSPACGRTTRCRSCRRPARRSSAPPST